MSAPQTIRLVLWMLLGGLLTSGVLSTSWAQSGPVGAYGFESGSGSTAFDASGLNHDGAISGATWSPQGRFGQALSFDGFDDWVTIASSAALGFGSGFTLEAWVYPTATPLGWRTLIAKEGPGTVIAYFLHVSSPDANQPAAGITLGGSEQHLKRGVPVPVDTWTHLATTYDGVQHRLYVNGVEVGSRSQSGSPEVTSEPLRLGGNAIWGEYFQGRLDEVRLYDRALSAAEIQQDMLTPVGSGLPPIDTTPPTVLLTAPGPGAVLSGTVTLTADATDDVAVSDVQFMRDGINLGAEDAAFPYAAVWDTTAVANGSYALSAVATDTAGNQTASAPVIVTVSNGGPIVASALRFYGNGVNDIDRVKIRLDDPLTTLPGPPVDVGAEDFTLEFWLRALPGDNTAAAIACGANNHWIFGNIIIDRDRFNQDRSFGLSMGNGRLVWGVDGQGAGRRTICGSTRVDDGNWHHVAVQRRRADGWMWLYVDGVLEAEANGPDGDISYPDDGVPGNFCNGPCDNSDPFLVIGAEKHDAGSQFPSFSGWIDELRLSNVLRYPSTFTVPTVPFVADANTVGLYHFDEGQGDVINDSANAAGGPSPGVRRFGGTPAGPQWTSETPWVP